MSVILGQGVVEMSTVYYVFKEKLAVFFQSVVLLCLTCNCSDKTVCKFILIILY